jgi:Plant transposon protein
MSIPSSLIHCLDEEGNIDTSLYFLYLRNKRSKAIEFDNLIANCMESTMESTQEDVGIKKNRNKRKCINLMSKDGVLYEIDPRSSIWYITYVLSPRIDDNKFEDKFRRRFRCSYSCYSNLLELVVADPLFSRWQNSDAFGRKSSPLELCVLGALRYIGRGCTFDDVEELTSVSEETLRRFFHSFIYWGSTVLYEKFVCFPTNALQVHDCTDMMESAGFHGCVASTDATHVTMMRCPVSRSNEHRGHKESLPARTYNISVNHKRKILHTTSGHPARWNDKTLTHYDIFIKSVRDQKILNDMQFTLFEKNPDNTISERKYSGCWIMCDNGYQNWSCLMSPIKNPIQFKEQRWSKWLESMRKDVECTFGILKGRFRILKTGIRLHKINSVDQLWRTCCALHNMFLEHDGLSRNWEDGVQSDWQGELGLHDNGDNYDYSGMGPGNDVYQGIDDTTNAVEQDDFVQDIPNTTNVRNCDSKVFKQKLIDHFDILFEKKLISWPKRNGTVEFRF